MGGLSLALVLLFGVDAGVAAAPSDGGAVEAAEPPPPVGPPPQAGMVCEPQLPRIGDMVGCTITVQHRGDVSIASITAPPGATFEKATPAEPGEGGLVTTRRFQVQVLSMKDLRIENVGLVWQEATGGEGRLALPPQRIPVKSVVEGAEDPTFRDYQSPGDDAFWAAHGPIPYKVTNWPLIITLLVVLGIGVGVGVGWLVRRWLEGRESEPTEWVDPRPAHVIALEALRALEAEKLVEQGEVKTYYFRMSEIVRGYLERRFDFPALEMTSDEIRDRLQALAIKAEARLSLDDFLSETDLVKFASFSPSDAAVGSLMPAARGLIELTREREEQTAAPPQEAPA